MFTTAYTYPDGTKSIRRPKDGEIFRVWDPVDQNETVWQWDGYKVSWYNITNKQTPKVVTGSTVKVFLNGIELEMAGDVSYDISMDEPKCECGSEKVGSNKHSTWCQKWSSQ